MKRIFRSLVLLLVWSLVLAGQAQAVFWCHCCQVVVVGAPDCQRACGIGAGEGSVAAAASGTVRPCCQEGGGCADDGATAGGGESLATDPAVACSGSCFRLLQSAPAVELTTETSGVQRIEAPAPPVALVGPGDLGEPWCGWGAGVGSAPPGIRGAPTAGEGIGWTRSREPIAVEGVALFLRIESLLL